MRKPPRRTNDPEGTRRNIVEVATREFAQKGYSGARVDAIAFANQHRLGDRPRVLRAHAAAYQRALDERTQIVQ